MEKPSAKAVVEATGISPSYASMILNESDDPDKSRKPPPSLAILIFRKTGWKHPVIAGANEEDMAAVERIAPWTPPKERQDEAA